MNILLVNDDGIDSPFLALLCRAAAARGNRVTVVAPAEQQSAKSHCFTIDRPLRAYPRQVEGAAAAWAVDGTPVDCCRVGLMRLCDQRPDLVLSGAGSGLPGRARYRGERRTPHAAGDACVLCGLGGSPGRAADPLPCAGVVRVQPERAARAPASAEGASHVSHYPQHLQG